MPHISKIFYFSSVYFRPWDWFSTPGELPREHIWNIQDCAYGVFLSYRPKIKPLHCGAHGAHRSPWVFAKKCFQHSTLHPPNKTLDNAVTCWFWMRKRCRSFWLTVDEKWPHRSLLSAEPNTPVRPRIQDDWILLKKSEHGPHAAISSFSFSFHLINGYISALWEGR